MDNNRPPRDMDSLVSIRIDGIEDSVRYWLFLAITHRREDLDRIFREYGDIADIYIPRDRNGSGNRGFCFVRYFNEDDARKALVENGKPLNGKEMTISIAEARPPRREYCFLCICYR